MQKTYWETYNYFTQEVHYAYFVILSLLTLFFYRVVLKRSLACFTKTVPFHLVKDKEFAAYFIQSKAIEFDDQNKVVIKQKINFFICYE
jgi:hypothetical protein